MISRRRYWTALSGLVGADVTFGMVSLIAQRLKIGVQGLQDAESAAWKGMTDEARCVRSGWDGRVRSMLVLGLGLWRWK